MKKHILVFLALAAMPSIIVAKGGGDEKENIAKRVGKCREFYEPLIAETQGHHDALMEQHNRAQVKNLKLFETICKLNSRIYKLEAARNYCFEHGLTKSKSQYEDLF